LLANIPGEPAEGSLSKIDPLALLLEYHASDPKVIEAVRRLPRGDATDAFLQTLFDKTFSPEVRWAAGARLIASLRRNDRPQEMEEIVIAMSEDRYLEGVPVGRNSNARTWAINKLREIRLLAIGKVLPEVSGEKLEGGVGQITDYRGKVVVLDVWTTWCGPCNRMIPHQVEMVERFAGKPFALLSVSCDRDQETLENFLEQTSMPWDHWWVAPDSQFKQALNISAFPTIFVLDGNGVIRHKNLMGEQLEEAIDALLAENEQSVAEPKN
jgi:thiol-disulfide isomerase/thioredoxin